MDRTHVAGALLLSMGVLLAGAAGTAAGVTATGGDVGPTASHAPPGTNESNGLTPVVDAVPGDVDGDGRHEDINGNDRFDSDDVVVYFESLESPAVTEHVTAYDYNGNDRIDFDDVVTLFDGSIVPVQNASDGNETSDPDGNESLPLDGAGTPSDPYEVGNLSALRTVRERPSAHYELVADVDATATWVEERHHLDDPPDFVPIGTADRPFTGTFDGNGHAITGLTIRAADERARVGTFGEIGENGTVRRFELVDATVSGGNFTGGVAGYNRGTIRNVSFEGEVSGSLQDDHPTGGLVGHNDGVLSHARAFGAVTGSGDAAGLVAVNEGTVREAIGNATVVLCGFHCNEGHYAFEHQNGRAEAVYQGSPYASLRRSYDIIRAPVQMRNGDAVTNMTGLDWGSDWHATPGYPVLAWQYDGVDLRGAGTLDHPYRIQSAADLSAMHEDPTANYTLAADVDASETATWNDGRGFEPVGDTSRPFTGTFFGDGHAVSGLTIDRPAAQQVGLFGQIGSDGRVTGLLLRDAEVTGGAGVGAVAGFSAGTVENASVNATVTGESSVGAAVGESSGAVRNVAAGGDVAGTRSVGGLVGRNTGGMIEHSLATARVDGETRAGGLVGRNLGTVDASYWDETASGRSTSAGGTGLTTAELSGEGVRENASGLGYVTPPLYDAPWVPTDGYPVPAVATDPVQLPGSGTATDPYRIDDAVDLQSMRANLSAHYELTADVNASVTATWNDGLGFDPVGTRNPELSAVQKERFRERDVARDYLLDLRRKAFQGTVDGNGYAIRGLTVDRPEAPTVGLFGRIGQHGVVRHVVLRNVSVGGGDAALESPADPATVGTLAGENNGTVTDVAVVGARLEPTEAATGTLVGLHADYGGSGALIEDVAVVDATVDAEHATGEMLVEHDAAPIRNATSNGHTVAG